MAVPSAEPNQTPAERQSAPGGQRQRIRGFGSSALWTVLGTIVPGVGLWRAGRRLVGGVVLGVFVLVIGGLGAFGLIQRDNLMQFAVDPNVLSGAAVALVVVALIWVWVITATYLELRSSRPSMLERIGGGALVGVLSFAVTAPLVLVANYAYTTATTISTIFDDDSDNPGSPSAPVAPGTDLWANTERLNVLLLGADSGVKSNRSLAVGSRTDTVMVASIDTHTGATTLITLPRNAEKVPFPPDSPLHRYYPNGFTAPEPNPDRPTRGEYLLNAMYRNVPAHVPNNILGKTKDFGASVLMQAVGYALGLDINYYAFVNLDGFKDFVNAIGGITINVNYAVPIGGHNASPPEPEEKPAGWIEPGPNRPLTGRLALWFARGRYHLNDYSRMERQRCVIQAITQQTTPAAVLTNYQGLAAASARNITTNIPRKLLPAMVELGLKVKNSKIRSLVFDPSTGFHSYKPDWNWVRDKVKKAIRETAANANLPSTSAPASAPTASTPTTRSTTKSDDLAAVCSYHPNDYTPTRR